MGERASGGEGSEVSCQSHLTCSSVPEAKRVCPHLRQLKESALFANFPYIHQYLLFFKRPLLTTPKVQQPECGCS
jgi:hypothetical protein